MRITEDQIICGVPALQLKSKLYALQQAGWGVVFPFETFERSLEEQLINEGYLRASGEGYCSTIKGNSLAMASTMEPMNREEIEDLMNLLLINIRIYNKTLGTDSTIGCAWVFGSYLSAKDSFNDLDLSFEIVPKGYIKKLRRLVSTKSPIPYEEVQEESFNFLKKFFKKLSPRFSIHHYREMGSLIVDVADFKYKMIYQSQSDDAKAFDQAKVLRIRQKKTQPIIMNNLNESDFLTKL